MNCRTFYLKEKIFFLLGSFILKPCLFTCLTIDREILIKCTHKWEIGWDINLKWQLLDKSHHWFMSEWRLIYFCQNFGVWVQCLMDVGATSRIWDKAARWAMGQEVPLCHEAYLWTSCLNHFACLFTPPAFSSHLWNSISYNRINPLTWPSCLL